MFGEFEERVRDKLELAARPSPEDKVMDLRDAVARFVRPGMHLHIAQAYLRPSAAINQVCRQFWDADPGFTLSSLGFIANMVLFVQGNLARRLITTFCGDHYPFPSPNRIYQEAFRDGRIEIENWSVLTLPQRLLAGATGVEWMPTHSIMGSGMAEENREDFHVYEDPDGQPLGMVRALRPDLTILHAWAADKAGNVLLVPPHAENVYAAFAAREGVVVTVEKVVDTQFLRRYSHYVKIPGYLVRAVCPVPMGVHPSGASNQGIREFDAYAEDEDFLLQLRAACKSDQSMRAWVDEWLLGCPDHDSYIEKLGYQRIWFLKGRSASDAWWSELATRAPQIDKSDVANPTEMMITAASRLIRGKVEENGYRTVLAGIGASNLAAWKAFYDLRRDGEPVDLMAEVGFFGYAPVPGDPFIFSFRNIGTCTMLTDVLTVLGSMVGAESSRCIGALGAGQVDKYGNINSTKIPEMKLWLVGSGGACDVATGAQEMVVTIALNKLRCVDKVSYVTAPGKRVTAVVTDLGIFEKLPGEETLTLTAYYANSGFTDGDEAAEAIAAKCGWELAVASCLQVIEPPTPDELKDIRIFDPRRYFLDE
jgi:acyl CoA:acetate/3-ketoacid CoA transferase alpha subunit/acyl CoA:acetate/3-ketoacid CoA transferase beta subunit